MAEPTAASAIAAAPPGAMREAIVSQRLDVAPDLIILQVAAKGWELPDFRCGQYAVLGLPASVPRCPTADPELPQDANRMIRRAYSIASSSLARNYLEFYVALVRSGELTPRLFSLRVGDPILIGRERFTVRGILLTEPGRRLSLFSLGPRRDQRPARQIARACRDSRAPSRTPTCVHHACTAPKISPSSMNSSTGAALIHAQSRDLRNTRETKRSRFSSSGGRGSTRREMRSTVSLPRCLVRAFWKVRFMGWMPSLIAAFSAGRPNASKPIGNNTL